MLMRDSKSAIRGNFLLFHDGLSIFKWASFLNHVKCHSNSLAGSTCWKCTETFQSCGFLGVILSCGLLTLHWKCFVEKIIFQYQIILIGCCLTSGLWGGKRSQTPCRKVRQQVTGHVGFWPQCMLWASSRATSAMRSSCPLHCGRESEWTVCNMLKLASGKRVQQNENSKYRK